MRQGTASLFPSKPRLTPDQGAVSRDPEGKIEIPEPVALDVKRKMRISVASTAAIAIGVFFLLGALGCMAATFIGDGL